MGAAHLVVIVSAGFKTDIQNGAPCNPRGGAVFFSPEKTKGERALCYTAHKKFDNYLDLKANLLSCH
jgi:hypothetical protein